jgi:hypothetical protein
VSLPGVSGGRGGAGRWGDGRRMGRCGCASAG